MANVPMMILVFFLVEHHINTLLISNWSSWILGSTNLNKESSKNVCNLETFVLLKVVYQKGLFYFLVFCSQYRNYTQFSFDLVLNNGTYILF